MADLLLDTSFFIDLRRGDAGASETWTRIEVGAVAGAYSSLTAYELWLSKSLTRSDEVFYTGMFTLLEEATLTAGVARQTALWIRSLPRRSRERRLRDAFIAASAAERSEAVCTRNVRDFRRYPVSIERY